MNYRSEARKCLARAKAEIESNDELRLRYAALELREALEALAYDMAEIHGDFNELRDYENWQPRKLVDFLLSIDASVDQNRAIFAGIEEVPGQPAKNMQFLGQETVLSMSDIKKNYDALGSYLHLQTKKYHHKNRDYTNLKSRLTALLSKIDKILSSRIWRAKFREFTQFECRCSTTFEISIPPSLDSWFAECPKCKTEYTLKKESMGVSIVENMQAIGCQNDICDHVFIVSKNNIKIGNVLVCPKCSANHEFVVGINCTFSISSN